MTAFEKHIAALTTAAKKAPDKAKLKAKIRKVKQKKANYNWLSQ